MTLGGLILIALVVSIIPICTKIREHSRKIKELEEIGKKLGIKAEVKR